MRICVSPRCQWNQVLNDEFTLQFVMLGISNVFICTPCVTSQERQVAAAAPPNNFKWSSLLLLFPLLLSLLLMLSFILPSSGTQSLFVSTYGDRKVVCSLTLFVWSFRLEWYTMLLVFHLYTRSLEGRSTYVLRWSVCPFPWPALCHCQGHDATLAPYYQVPLQERTQRSHVIFRLKSCCWVQVRNTTLGPFLPSNQTISAMIHWDVRANTALAQVDACPKNHNRNGLPAGEEHT